MKNKSQVDDPLLWVPRLAMRDPQAGAPVAGPIDTAQSGATRPISGLGTGR